MEVLTENDLMVVKRNGKKVDFDGNKIALAIKKGFENIAILGEPLEDGTLYIEKDVNKVYMGVIKKINSNYKNEDKIKIEDIQDLIELELNKQGYEKVCEAFSEYRVRRAKSREIFFDDKKRHNFLKTIEGFETTIFCHEFDHLNGILHMDIAEEVLVMPKEERKKFRQTHQYEIISKTGKYE